MSRYVAGIAAIPFALGGVRFFQFAAMAAAISIITTNIIRTMNMAFTILRACCACFFSRAEILFFLFWLMVIGFYG